MVTSLEALKAVKCSKEVPLPPFPDGTPFIAELRKISLMDMAKKGRIPNPLLQSVFTVIGFESSTEKEDSNKASKDSDSMNSLEALDFMDSVVQNSLVSPTYQQIVDCGVELSDEQVFAIFGYAIGDLELLSKFCDVPGNSEHSVNGKDVSSTPK